MMNEVYERREFWKRTQQTRPVHGALRNMVDWDEVSRGLLLYCNAPARVRTCVIEVSGRIGEASHPGEVQCDGQGPVSYTHLTLPTILLV